MICVEFLSTSPGTCAWCRKEKDEVYSVAFSDKSFVGQMCKGDLLRAIGMRLTNGQAEAKPIAAAALSGPAVAAK